MFFKITEDGLVDLFDSPHYFWDNPPSEVDIRFLKLRAKPLNTYQAINSDSVVIGYKLFSLEYPYQHPFSEAHRHITKIRLRGSYSIWDTSTFFANCDAYQNNFSDYKTVRSHLMALGEYCRCGIYSFNTLTALAHEMAPSTQDWRNVIAEVVNWGAVKPYTFGYKAEISRITRIWILTEHNYTGRLEKKLIELNYPEIPVKVIDQTEFEDMLKNENS